jgi:uncharacterized protein (DUF2237 family)
MSALNVLGTTLASCSHNPLTGFFRDGCCNTDNTDQGMHTVCIIATDEFLNYSKSAGNDLSTPHPEYNFPGVKAGQSWCLCAPRWLEAYRAGKAPLVNLQATHEETLAVIPLSLLQEYQNH